MQTIKPIYQTDLVPLEDAVGQFVARDIYAKIAVPPFTISLIDGYALGKPVSTNKWILKSEVRELQEGQAVMVGAGARLPENTYTILKKADVEITNQELQPLTNIIADNGIGDKGADIPNKSLLLLKNTKITPQKVAVLAATGYCTAEVYKHPKVILISVGNDFQMPGQTLEQNQIYNFSIMTLHAILTSLGADVLETIQVGVNQEALRSTLSVAVARADLVIINGDIPNVADILIRMGKIHFQGLNTNIAREVLYASVESTPILYFPDSNVATAVLAHYILPNIMRIFYNYVNFNTRVVETSLSEEIPANHVYQIFIGYIDNDRFVRLPNTTMSYSTAHGYIVIPPTDTDIPVGALVNFYYF